MRTSHRRSRLLEGGRRTTWNNSGIATDDAAPRGFNDTDLEHRYGHIAQCSPTIVDRGAMVRDGHAFCIGGRNTYLAKI